MGCKIKSYFAALDGATAIEYGMIGGGVCLVIAGSIYAFGDALELMITGLTSALDGNPDGSF